MRMNEECVEAHLVVGECQLVGNSFMEFTGFMHLCRLSVFCIDGVALTVQRAVHIT